MHWAILAVEFAALEVREVKKVKDPRAPVTAMA